MNDLSSTKPPEGRSLTKNQASVVQPGSLHFGEVFTHSSAHCRVDNYTLLTKNKISTFGLKKPGIPSTLERLHQTQLNTWEH